MALVTCAYVFGLIWVFGHLELFTPSYVCCDGCNNAYLLTAIFTVICGVWMAICWRFYNDARDKADMEERRKLANVQCVDISGNVGVNQEIQVQVMVRPKSRGLYPSSIVRRKTVKK